MAYYINDKELSEIIDINYILDFFKDEQHVKIINKEGEGYQSKTILILFPSSREQRYENSSYKHTTYTNTVSIYRGESIMINPFSDKNGKNNTKEIHDYILKFKSYQRDMILKQII